jgi:hypothetical protein
MIETKANYCGRWYTIYTQEWGQDCGPTCVAIAKKILTGVGSDISWLRTHTKAKLVSPGIQSKIEALGLQSRDTGTHIDNLPLLAKAIGLSASYKHYAPPMLLGQLKTCGHGKVFICHVSWKSGGGHYVVVPFVDASGEVIVLDPYYGLQTTKNCPYYPGGSLSGHVVEVRR